jgi:hypothetical protein
MNHLSSIDLFRSEFDRLTADWFWEIEGFLDKRDFVHPIDTDTKVLSTVFERLASPVIRTIAEESGYEVEISNQTTYPDFTLTNASTGDRIAIDIKTTYESTRMVLTLGGYNSFLRAETKNILYPYSTYKRHWIIGFIYRQLLAYPPYTVQNMPVRGDIECPYKVLNVFVREKHEISGLRAGSGNTKNIGSVVVATPANFSTVMGPFTRFRDGKAACDHFWRNYELYVPQISTPGQLLAHPDFQRFGPVTS